MKYVFKVEFLVNDQWVQSEARVILGESIHSEGVSEYSEIDVKNIRLEYSARETNKLNDSERIKKREKK